MSWIYVDEGLPEFPDDHEGRVLATFNCADEHGVVGEVWYYGDDEWEDVFTTSTDIDVIAWQYLPEPAPRRRPIEQYKLVKVHTRDIRCSCGRQLLVVPKWDTESSLYPLQCDKCGCSTNVMLTGRPFARRSKYWDELQDEFRYLLETTENRAALLKTVEYRIVENQ